MPGTKERKQTTDNRCKLKGNGPYAYRREDGVLDAFYSI